MLFLESLGWGPLLRFAGNAARFFRVHRCFSVFFGVFRCFHFAGAVLGGPFQVSAVSSLPSLASRR